MIARTPSLNLLDLSFSHSYGLKLEAVEAWRSLLAAEQVLEEYRGTWRYCDFTLPCYSFCPCWCAEYLSPARLSYFITDSIFIAGMGAKNIQQDSMTFLLLPALLEAGLINEVSGGIALLPI
jgi:hypothetical protein